MNLQEHVPLASYTTLQVGGTARYLITIESIKDLQKAQQFAQQIAAPLCVFGLGSNILPADEGFPGIVLHNKIFGREYVSSVDGSVTARIGAGEIFDDCVADMVERGYWGLENLSHIPGTIGATPIQNVGAYGVEVSSLIVSVEAVSLSTGKSAVFSNQDCQFGYRDSYFKTEPGRDWFVTHVTFTLSTTEQPQLTYADLQSLTSESDATPTLQQIRDKVIAIRSNKFPDWHTVGTAGSFFKNPIIEADHAAKLLKKYPGLPQYPHPSGFVKVSLGWILDHVCHLKGTYDGQVGLYENQALVLVNTGSSATAVREFAAKVQVAVYEKTRINIEPEVRYL